MPFSLVSSNILVRGNFNPYIFSPEWLIANRVWDDEEVHLVLGAMGEGVRFRGVKSAVEWSVDYQTMIIAGSLAIDCGLYACKILSLLPHTPVRAVGCNFAYSSSNWDSPFIPKLGPKALSDLPKNWNPELTKWSAVFHVEETRIDMSVECGDQGVTTSFNFHTAVDSATNAEKTASHFAKFRSDSEQLISIVLEGEVQPI